MKKENDIPRGMREEFVTYTSVGVGVVLLIIAYVWVATITLTQRLVEISLICGLVAIFINRADRKYRELQAQYNNERAQWQQDLKQAHTTLKAKSEFISMLSHEINNALQGIIAGVHLFLKDQVETSRMKLSRDILANTNLLSNLMSNTLIYSSVESGTICLRREPYDIRALLESIVTAVSQSAFDKGLGIYSFIDPSVPKYIIGDETRVTQIVLNLLSNAVKYTDSGYVQLRCHIVTDSNELVIECEDTGIGLNDTVTQQITNDKSTALGLGLTICKKLTLLLKGRLKVTSDEGKGTRFSIDLPVELPTSGECAQAEEPISTTGNSRAIVISSDPLQCEIMKSYLTYLGVSQIEIVQRIDASSFILTLQPIFVFVDDDSTEYLDFLLQNHSDSHINIIRITNQIIHSQFNRRVDVLRKPIKLEQLGYEISIPFSPHGSETDGTEEDGPDLSSFTVLLVENNAISSRVMVALLKKLGVTKVTLASNGLEGQRKYVEAVERGGTFDLIMSDIAMPVMNGCEFCGAIRKYEEEHQTVPSTIIAVTAYAQVEDHRLMLRSGFDHIITKPVKLETLTEYIGLLRYTPFK